MSSVQSFAGPFAVLRIVVLSDSALAAEAESEEAGKHKLDVVALGHTAAAESAHEPQVAGSVFVVESGKDVS